MEDASQTCIGDEEPDREIETVREVRLEEVFLRIDVVGA
jgi:hypothetical protein